jgi:uncharacterized protein
MTDTMPTPSPPGPAGPWPVLDMLERRILGVLVEKQKTGKSADTYPLSLNALVTGCNQKSNRDPILDLVEEEVDERLGRCLKKNLVARVTSTRVMRWRHLLYEAWHVDKLDLAILAELLLRGPQTEGELRTRASRMEPIDDLDALRSALKPLVQRKLVIYLTPEDRRGAVVTHGFHDPRELERLRAHHLAHPASVPEIGQRSTGSEPSSGPSRSFDDHLSTLQSQLLAAQNEINALRKTLAEQQAMMNNLVAELHGLKKALGV